jgi:hypothetical protein
VDTNGHFRAFVSGLKIPFPGKQRRVRRDSVRIQSYCALRGATTASARSPAWRPRGRRQAFAALAPFDVLERLAGEVPCFEGLKKAPDSSPLPPPFSVDGRRQKSPPGHSRPGELNGRFGLIRL